ncbi:MAG: serpin family protein [Planctomycetia bacterium]|nr:serpin family protein [Planctomycetia bacterium]
MLRINMQLCTACIAVFATLFYVSGCSYADNSGMNADSTKAAASENAKKGVKDITSSFSLAWYQQCVSENVKQNLVLSPLSAYRMLGTLYQGSAGETQNQIRSAMQWDGDLPTWQTAMRESADVWNSLKEMTLADGVWIQDNYKINADFIQTLWRTASVEVKNTNFGSENARTEVNKWVAAKTEGKIPELLDSLSEDTQILMANTLVFQGRWAHAFDERDSRKGYFTSIDGDEYRYPMMQTESEFRYYQGEDYQWLEMPYEGKKFSLMVLLPKDRGLFMEQEKNLTPEFVEKCRKEAKRTKVDVRFPKFTMRCTHQLIPSLTKMGVQDAFQAVANFSPMTESDDVMVTQIRQGIFLKVNEEGTEAAAATAVEFYPKAMNDGTPKFYADRPFVFMIRENTTGAILFVGRFVDPEGMEEATEISQEDRAQMVSGGTAETVNEESNSVEGKKPEVESNGTPEKEETTSETDFNTSGVGGSME